MQMNYSFCLQIEKEIKKKNLFSLFNLDYDYEYNINRSNELKSLYYLFYLKNNRLPQENLIFKNFKNYLQSINFFNEDILDFSTYLNKKVTENFIINVSYFSIEKNNLIKKKNDYLYNDNNLINWFDNVLINKFKTLSENFLNKNLSEEFSFHKRALDLNYYSPTEFTQNTYFLMLFRNRKLKLHSSEYQFYYEFHTLRRKIRNIRVFDNLNFNWLEIERHKVQKNFFVYDYLRWKGNRRISKKIF